MTNGPIERVTDWGALARAIRGFEDLEQAVTAYVELMQAGESVRLMEADLCRRVSEQMGRAGLKAVAQASHRRATVLARQAAVAKLVPLLERFPVLSYTHLEILSRLDIPDVEGFAVAAADQGWSPAELRRAIAASRGVEDDPSTIVKKADSATERLKGLADEADQAGVLPEVADRIRSAYEYASAKMEAEKSG